jgi:hypothetical protein
MRYSTASLIIFAVAACADDSSAPTDVLALPRAQAAVASFTFITFTALSGQGAGRVHVATTAHDVTGPETFDVQGTVNVHGALPNTTFTVLRRVDLNPDGVCTGAAWLTLPAPNAQTFTTSAGGAGAMHFQISRGSPFVNGVQFDVQWRLEGSDGSVLESDCFTVTVK